ncbi:MAG: transglutaminase-like domain-containing protein [bacterium]|nr:transglutaminase-like domain-containing protein [bacterium]
MNENKSNHIRWNEILYRFIYTELLLCILLFAGGYYCGISAPGFWHLLVGTLMIAALTVLTYTGLKGRLFCGLGICAVAAVIIVFVTPARLGVFFSYYSSWLFTGAAAVDEQRLLYEIVQTLLLSIICYGVQVLLECLQKVRIIITVLLVVALLLCMFFRQPMSHMGVIWIIWYTVLTYVEWTKLHWKKERSQNEKSYMLWILPFCVVYLIVLSLIPIPDKPYDWKLVKEAYASVKESVTALIEDITNGDAEDFGINFAGFTENAKLKGDIHDLNQQIMTVQGIATLKTNVYLSGKTYDSFDGRSWKVRQQGYPNERQLDTLETLYAIRMYEGNRNDFAAETRLTVRYRYFQSAHLFAPAKILTLDCDKAYTQDADLRFEKKQSYGMRYDLTFLQLNLDQPTLYEYMETEIPENREIWEGLTVMYVPDRENRPSWDELQTHEAYVHQNYAADTKLSDFAMEMLDGITEGETTAIGKLRAIERELSSYAYTTTPGAIPKNIDNGTDFLDYFLKSKEGYCSYFATAFVLLARAEGIPARYVEGFCVATEPNKEISVNSGNSHAWPEAYIDGFGWVPFEPTPGYAEIRYTPWNINGTVYKETAGKPYGGSEPQHAEEPEATEEEKQYDAQNTYRLFSIIGMTLTTAFVLLILFLIGERLYRRYQYRRMSTEEQFVTEVKRNLWLLSKMKIEREPFETLRELKKRGEKELKGLQMSFLNDYEAYIYGEAYISDEMLKKVILQQTQLLMLHKEKRRWHYYWLRFIM